MTTADTIIALELGHYRLREQIGGSAYGVIWRASGPHGTRDVALKLINQPQMDRADPLLRERWIASAANEITFLQSLEPWDERHIVRLLDSGWHDGLPVLALELMTGDLGKHVSQLKACGEAPDFPSVLDWLGQINQALAKVHQYGWRYLDLKPANLLFDRHLNAVKLADFGTNRQLSQLHAHSYAGTANWQAPEQFFPAPGGGYSTGTHSDYFSLGALFYFLVTGGQALRFCGDCGEAYRAHHTYGAEVLLQQNGGTLPAVLHEDEEARFSASITRSHPRAQDAALTLLRTLLHADPAQRPRHAIQISRMLAAIQNSVPERVMPGLPAMVQNLRRPAADNGWLTIQGAR
jgi:serine/threonine-protein kinase